MSADLVDDLNALLRERFGEDLQVGASHFMTDQLTDDRLKQIWSTSIMPFLEDQLYDTDASLDESNYPASSARQRGLPRNTKSKPTMRTLQVQEYATKPETLSAHEVRDLVD